MPTNAPYDALLTSEPWRSRRFWTVVIDCAVSLILYFSAKYLAPALADDVTTVIAALQPIFGLALALFTYDDYNARAMTIKLAQTLNLPSTFTTNVPTYIDDTLFPPEDDDNNVALKENDTQRE